MEDYMLSFVEGIISAYKLEEDLLENDLLLKEKIEETDNLSDLPIIKILYSEKVKERLEKGVSLEEVLPSIKLKNILNKLIDKEIDYEELPKIIGEKLEVDESIAKKISDTIKKSPEISKERNTPITEKATEESNEPKKIPIEKQNIDNEKSIGYQLLK